MGRTKAPTTELSPASLPADHIMVQLGPPKGSNNFTSTGVDGTERLVEISSKIRKSVLVTRGDFAFVKLFPSSEHDRPGSLAGEIIHVAGDREVRDWKRAGEWPNGFGERLVPLAATEVEANEENDKQEVIAQNEDRAETDITTRNDEA